MWHLRQPLMSSCKQMLNHQFSILVALLATSALTLPNPAKKPPVFYDHMDWSPYVNWCSDFDHNNCEGIQEHDILGSGSCITLDPTILQKNGGISALKVHKAYCQFFPVDDCYRHTDPMLEHSSFIELPLGTNLRVPQNFGDSVFRQGDMEICNLWEYTTKTDNGIEHWDNKIRAYICVVRQDQPDQPVCS